MSVYTENFAKMYNLPLRGVVELPSGVELMEFGVVEPQNYHSKRCFYNFLLNESIAINMSLGLQDIKKSFVDSVDHYKFRPNYLFIKETLPLNSSKHVYAKTGAVHATSDWNGVDSGIMTSTRFALQIINNYLPNLTYLSENVSCKTAKQFIKRKNKYISNLD